MESPRKKNLLTESQLKAVRKRGNVLVMAGAGTGKTHTLVERCLDCIVREGASLDKILVVTFTEAAAAEMKQRLRRALENSINHQPSTLNQFAAEQLALFDAAHIGTLHSFCLKLVREHFYELGLDPQPAVLAEGEARMLAAETLEEQFHSHYEGEDEFSLAAQNLIHIYGGGRDEKIRVLVLRLHHYAQTRPDAEGWLANQVGKFSASEPADWQQWLLAAICDWRDEWLPVLENLKSRNEKAAELTGVLLRFGGAGVPPAKSSVAPDLLSNKGVRRDAERGRPEACATMISRQFAAEILGQITAADSTASYPKGKAGKLRPALGDIFDEAAFLASLARFKDGNDPLAEDWIWIRGHMAALLRLAQEFAEKFSERKRADGVLDFHDLEQFALKLLWDFAVNKPTAIAQRWREKLRFVFVDEYQDINAAQDKIISALARDGASANRFLVGDVKQSIYRFRLADPKIFRDYAKSWRGQDGQTIPLAENFRSRESLLNLVNSLFAPLMREEIGGVNYDAEAQLRFGAPGQRAELGLAANPSPRAELLLRLKPGRDAEAAVDELADLGEAEKEARVVALYLKKLVAEKDEIWDERKKIFRAAEWHDMAVLLRSPSGKAEIFAKEFERAGVPLVVERGGFYESSEILDLLSLLQLLDNPLQDVPCIAVLRSPLVGCSLDELAEVRLAGSGHFWFALNQIHNSKSKITKELQAKVEVFLERFQRWRKLAQQSSLLQCLEAVLAETFYADWLRSRPRGAQRRANVAQFLHLAQWFDQFQRQGLFRFLNFIEAQRGVEAEPEVPGVAAENVVRLMSIHQSKGLEFPVVVVADLAKRFNEQDLRGEIIFDEELGVCPKVQSPNGRRYPSLPHWLAQWRQRRELRGEELRLLYVAMTRARDTLILTGSVSERSWCEDWNEPAAITPQTIAGANSFADWLALWFAQNANGTGTAATGGELAHLRWRLIEDAELANRWGETTGEPILADGHSGSRGRSPHQLKPFDDATAKKLRDRLERKYPFEAATKRKAKASVTELRRAAEESDDEAEQVFQPRKFPTKRPRGKLSAAEAGAAHHKFLQHVALEKSGDRATLAEEAERLARENILSEEERVVLNLDALAEFWDSPLGRKIRAQPPDLVRRELPFTAKFSPAELSQITGKKAEAGLEDEFIVVQGVADLAVLLPEEIWLVDFKTDVVSVRELPKRLKTYSPQLKIYAAALEKIFGRKVTLRALHFLMARRTEEI